MTHKLLAFLALLAALFGVAPTAMAAGGSFASTAGQYQSLILTNQFGETSINTIKGGSQQIDCNFVIDSTNANGLGISSLKGPGCASVYMHTTQTPAAGNPNPPAGYILVQLSKNYAGFIGGYSQFSSPVSGTPVGVASVVENTPYVITTVGTTSTANWHSIGLPSGVTPAVGAVFVSPSPLPSPTPSGTGFMEVPAASGAGALLVDVIGDPNKTVAAVGGATLLLRVLSGNIPTALPSPAPTPITLAAKAPADTTLVSLRFVMLPTAGALK